MNICLSLILVAKVCSIYEDSYLVYIMLYMVLFYYHRYYDNNNTIRLQYVQFFQRLLWLYNHRWWELIQYCEKLATYVVRKKKINMPFKIQLRLSAYTLLFTNISEYWLRKRLKIQLTTCSLKKLYWDIHYLTDEYT